MRVLLTNKPINTRNLKAGGDNYGYDQVKKLWLPGRSTPVIRPDMSLVRKRKPHKPGSVTIKGPHLFLPVKSKAKKV